MPRLSAEEARELGVIDEPDVEVPVDEYELKRDALMEKAETPAETAAIAEKYPSAPELARRQAEEEKARRHQEFMESRRPQSKEEQEEFLQKFDEIDDRDKEAQRAFLEQHGMLAEPMYSGEEFA